MNFRVPLALLAAGAVLFAAGCSGTKQTPDAQPSFPVVHCDKAPDSTVGSALGFEVTPAQEADQPPVSVCTYPLKSGQGVVVLRFQTEVDSARFGEIRRGFTGATSDLAGYHDEAFTATTGSGDGALTSLAARRGSTAIVVTAPATLDQEKALLDAVFSTV